MSQVHYFTVDARLVHLFEKLATLNVVLGEKIVTREDFELFLEKIIEWHK
ncbi:hypothetical protein L1D94_18095 [Vibrio alginolyticus]|nr:MULTISPECIES: hypothetical protein [Vibrio]MCG9718529.1 hypothetical protein [Vibrio alginolyticus]MDW1872654.1 hypothetical protein [Vibrio sp. Vb0598]MDY8151440.1 hypothetical protein [Vibrio sp. PBL-C16]